MELVFAPFLDWINLLIAVEEELAPSHHRHHHRQPVSQTLVPQFSPTSQQVRSADEGPHHRDVDLRPLRYAGAHPRSNKNSDPEIKHSKTHQIGGGTKKRRHRRRRRPSRGKDSSSVGVCSGTGGGVGLRSVAAVDSQVLERVINRVNKCSTETAKRLTSIKLVLRLLLVADAPVGWGHSAGGFFVLSPSQSRPQGAPCHRGAFRTERAADFARRK